MTRVRAVLFDYGHTLVDFQLAEENLLSCYESVRASLAARAYVDVPQASAFVSDVSRRVAATITESYERRQLEELDIVSLFDHSLRGLGVEVPEDVVREIAEMEHRALIDHIQVSEENLNVLRHLKERGLRIGLVSNATMLPSMMRSDIERLGVAALVDEAVFSSELGVRKPHAGIFRHVLEALRVDATEAVFVGDRLEDDVAGAQEVGMRGVLTREFRDEDPALSQVNPDHVVRRLAEVVSYVETLMS